MPQPRSALALDTDAPWTRLRRRRSILVRADRVIR